MKIPGCRIIVVGLAAMLAFAGAPASATPTSTSLAPRAAPRANHIVTARWQRIRVPAGILAGVPTGSIPGGARLVTVYPPYPIGFSADPYFSPPAVVVAPPPLVFAPPPLAFAPAPVAFAQPTFPLAPPPFPLAPPPFPLAPPPFPFGPPPFLSDVAPIWLPFDGGCFVPSDNVGLHGYFGACADAFYQQWASRPG
jgi:hypothetical protein